LEPQGAAGGASAVKELNYQLIQRASTAAPRT
jgi:hypothetical protein